MNLLLETERLVLRQFTVADVDDLVELDSDPEVMLTPRMPSWGADIPRVVARSDRGDRARRRGVRIDQVGLAADVETADG